MLITKDEISTIVPKSTNTVHSSLSTNNTLEFYIQVLTRKMPCDMYLRPFKYMCTSKLVLVTRIINIEKY